MPALHGEKRQLMAVVHRGLSSGHLLLLRIFNIKIRVVVSVLGDNTVGTGA
jgi:hypothetical protein